MYRINLMNFWVYVFVTYNNGCADAYAAIDDIRQFAIETMPFQSKKENNKRNEKTQQRHTHHDST